MLRRITRAILPGILVAGLLVVGGCGSSNGEASAGSFDGPWGLQYRDAYDKATSEEIRSILIDEKITDAEYDQVLQLYSDCLGTRGYTLLMEGADIGVKAPHADSERMQSDIQDCGTSTGFAAIEYLYQMTGEKAQSKTVEALVTCLQRHGLADSTMTVDEYKRIYEDEELDKQMFGKYFDEGNPEYDAEKAKEYWACQANSGS